MRRREVGFREVGFREEGMEMAMKETEKRTGRGG